MSELRAARSEIQVLNEELEERFERSTALLEIDRAITGRLDLGFILDTVLEQVTRRLRVDAASILLFKTVSRALRYGATRGLRYAAPHRMDLRLGEGLPVGPLWSGRG